MVRRARSSQKHKVPRLLGSDNPPDIPLLIAVTLLLGFGLIAVYSTSAYTAGRNLGLSSHYLEMQLFAGVIGLFALYLISRCNYQILKDLAWPGLAVTIVLLSIVFIPGIGKKVGGAWRWINLPVLRFQPSELAKLTLAVFMAYLLSRRRPWEPETKRRKSKEELIPIPPAARGWVDFLLLLLAPLMVAGLVAAEPDLSYAVMIMTIAMVMLFAGGVSLRYMAALTLLGLAAVALMIYLKPYRMARFTAFLDPWADARGTGYQIIQSLVAIGAGGFKGLGLDQSLQKKGFLPEAHTDSIFSIIGEEFGFIGSLVLISLYAVILWRGARIAVRTLDPFGRLLAIGITAMVTYQAMINFAVVTGMMPYTGIPLPLISYGGSSLCINLAALGILLGISRDLSPASQAPRGNSNAPREKGPEE